MRVHVIVRLIDRLYVGRDGRNDRPHGTERTMQSTSTATRRALPREPAPALDVDLLSGGTFVLSEQRPARFSMVVFFRGLHCPVCSGQLRELERGLDELATRGVEVVAVSGETLERTQQLRDAWRLERLPLGYGLTEQQMRDWGLFVSRGLDGEPALFNEPGLFLIAVDGTVFYESLLSMPVGRPRLPDLLAGIDWWVEHGYPARGEA
jgi:peroxiredoxin